MTYQLGVGAGMGLQIPVAEQLPMIKAAGFEAFFTGWHPDHVEIYRGIARREGLTWETIHAPFKNAHRMWLEGNEDGEALTETLLAAVCGCARAEVPILVVHPYTSNHDYPVTDAGLSRFERVIRAAERAGVTLAFENLEYLPYLKAIFDAFGSSPAVRFCWDSGHEHCYGLGLDYMAMYGEKLTCVHLHDNFGNQDPAVITWHDDLHLLPFDGDDDFDRVAAKLRDARFGGAIMLELTTKNPPDHPLHDRYREMGAAAFLAEACARARRIAEKS